MPYLTCADNDELARDVLAEFEGMWHHEPRNWSLCLEEGCSIWVLQDGRQFIVSTHDAVNTLLAFKKGWKDVYRRLAERWPKELNGPTTTDLFSMVTGALRVFVWRKPLELKTGEIAMTTAFTIDAVCKPTRSQADALEGMVQHRLLEGDKVKVFFYSPATDTGFQGFVHSVRFLLEGEA